MKPTSMLVGVMCALPVAVLARPGTYEESEPVALGDGEIRSYGIVQDRVPVEFGVRFGENVFDNAPTEESDGTSDILDADGNVVWHCCGHERKPAMPKNIGRTTRFRHIVLNWNPMGHPPPNGIYRPPHIDFHFYTISESERESIAVPTAETMCSPEIPLTCDDFATATAPLPTDQFPETFISPGAVEPHMGNHLLWSGSPEPNGLPFTHTWIYGTWDSDISFWEPMITRDYLTGLVDEHNEPRAAPEAGFLDCYPLPASPEAAPKAGYYPSRYCIANDGAEIRVYLTDFNWLERSDG